ncbi:hypothetical protein ACJ73_03643 [Blastomyces percursus]|uniref:Uncharacterized protein n=1 Tax=Blastomyces percursus TaxID=1658174 RepID=A0A1J9RBF0_9EURO|nr:hypothetical protein ACJ73_03643 [Blastomyces percursus]
MADEGKRKTTEEEESIAVPAEASAAEPIAEKKQDEPSSTTTTPAAAVAEAGDDGNQAPVQPTPGAPEGDEEEGSDLEDLDDVLDDFSASKKPTDTASASSKNAPSVSTTAPQPPPPSLLPDQNTTRAPESDLDENAFIQQLEQSMAELMGSATAGAQGSGGGGDDDGDGEPDWDALAQRMAQGDMDPAAIMKLLIGEGGAGALAGESEADLGGGNKDEKGQGDDKSGTTATGTAGSSGGASKAEDGFQETIRKTMERMQASGDKATAAATEDGTDDMLMQLLKAMESGAGGAGGGDDENLDKIFMGIMEQLSNKEMLYEPMKELHDKFGPWLLENREKVPKEDLERYELQSVLVAEIVGKFDEEGYSDEKPADRAYIWEKMQKMQAAGSPPDALVSNPLADELGLSGAFAGGGGDTEMPQCPQQ